MPFGRLIGLDISWWLVLCQVILLRLGESFQDAHLVVCVITEQLRFIMGVSYLTTASVKLNKQELAVAMTHACTARCSSKAMLMYSTQGNCAHKDVFGSWRSHHRYPVSSSWQVDLCAAILSCFFTLSCSQLGSIRRQQKKIALFYRPSDQIVAGRFNKHVLLKPVRD